jgi:hypothetical protein
MDDATLEKRVEELEKYVVALKAEIAARGLPGGGGGIAPQGSGTVSAKKVTAFPANSDEQSERVCGMFSGRLNSLQGDVDEAEKTTT